MHEFSIAQSLVDMADNHAHQAGAGRVRRLNCRIGVLRQIEDSMMRDAFAAASQGTCCESAELCIEHVQMSAKCPECGRQFAVVDWHWNCPECGSAGATQPGGDELELVSIEAEERT